MLRFSFSRLLFSLMVCAVTAMLFMYSQVFSTDTLYKAKNVDIFRNIPVENYRTPKVHSHLDTDSVELTNVERLEKIINILGLPRDFIGHVKYPQAKIVEIKETVHDYLGPHSGVLADEALNTILQTLFVNQHKTFEPNGEIEKEIDLNDPGGRVPVYATLQVQDATVKVHSINDILEKPFAVPPKELHIKADELPYTKELGYKQSECPDSFVSKSKKSNWFRDRYVPNVKMFLSKEDVNTFENYNKLAHYALPFGFARENRTLLAEVLNHPHYVSSYISDILPRKTCTRCAVVGCGGVLKGAGKGPEIDAHDHVFRVNRALTQGKYANDVGTRTTFYTFFPESDYSREIDKTETTFYLYGIFKKYDITFGGHMIEDIPPPIYESSRSAPWYPQKPKVNIEQLRILHPDFIRYVFTHYLDSKSARPTTGALVVFLAVHLCDEVNLYGFGYDNRFTHHYYDKQFVAHSDSDTNAHDVDNERVLWRRLHEEGVVTLFNRTSVDN